MLYFFLVRIRVYKEMVIVFTVARPAPSVSLAVLCVSPYMSALCSDCDCRWQVELKCTIKLAVEIEQDPFTILHTENFVSCNPILNACI